MSIIREFRGWLSDFVDPLSEQDYEGVREMRQMNETDQSLIDTISEKEREIQRLLDVITHGYRDEQFLRVRYLALQEALAEIESLPAQSEDWHENDVSVRVARETLLRDTKAWNEWADDGA